jgi:hypothetical protein
MTRMSFGFSRNSFQAALVVFVAVACLYLPARLRAADPTDQVDALLAAGEFGPALVAAGKANDAKLKDKLLGDIAAAQAQGGARQASLETAYDIASDVARKSALDRVASQRGTGARGGGSGADFDSLMELIKSTINPNSWDDLGGVGSVSPFEGGVYVDPAGLLKKLPQGTDRSLTAVRRAALAGIHTGNPRQSGELRKISLTRLEREVQLQHALGRQPDETMQTLAGLRRIKYILVYPEAGDIVLAGPAGDWRRDYEGRLVAADSGAPVVNLDDLVVTLRNAYSELGRFGCSITPRQDNLAAAKAVNEKWSRQPLKPGQRDKWLNEFRSAVGRQDIEVYGIDRRTRAARVLIEADYRMKLVGIGLEEGTQGVVSYLDSIEIPKGGSPPPLSVLRWWFTLNYDGLSATEARDAFELRGPGVKVLSENELLTAIGERVHTGASDELNSKFAESFTKQFEKLAVKYPVYADLRNIFDLSLVAAVIRSHDLPEQVGWHLTHFGPSGAYAPELGPAPTEVESVLNHKVIGGKHIIAAVSGGVAVDARKVVKPEAVKTDTYGLMSGERRAGTPKNLPRRTWWWD